MAMVIQQLSNWWKKISGIPLYINLGTSGQVEPQMFSKASWITYMKESKFLMGFEPPAVRG
jgi:hypothetical protein